MMIGRDPSLTRLSQVAQKLRRVTFSLVTLLVVVAGLLALQYGLANELRVRKIVIVDASGRERISLDAQGAGSVLMMFGPDGANLMLFSATPNGGVNQLQDRAGRDRVIVNDSSRPLILFFGEQGAYTPWKMAPAED